MNLYYSFIARKLGLARATIWGVAFRKKTTNSILLDKNSRDTPPFIVVPNTREYWFADPLLFSDNNKTFLFVEAYSYERHKGELGVFDVVDDNVVNFRKIIETPSHMSYPFVFKWKGDYYMIPETGAAKEIALYKASSFPNEWIKDKVLISGEVYRDNTVFQDNDGNIKLISYRQTGSNRFDLKYYVDLFDLNMEKKELTLLIEKRDKVKINRPAGPVMRIDGHNYRLTQRCNRAYGESIFVYNMDSDLDLNRRQIVSELRGQHITLSDGSKPILLHTYSQTDEYEVIDYRCLA